MNIQQAFKMAFRSILGNKGRSVLTMLGIIIGIASVMTIVSTINGMNQQSLKQFEAMGTNKITVSAQRYDGQDVFQDLYDYCLHIEGDDLGLNGGLSLTLEKSDVYERTGHPCRLDFERFGKHIGLKKKRIEMILDSFSLLPDEVELLVNNSFLTEKMKRTYLRIVKERIQRFNRKSE